MTYKNEKYISEKFISDVNNALSEFDGRIISEELIHEMEDKANKIADIYFEGLASFRGVPVSRESLSSGIVNENTKFDTVLMVLCDMTTGDIIFSEDIEKYFMDANKNYLMGGNSNDKDSRS